MFKKIGFKLLLGVAVVILAAVAYTVINNENQKISFNDMSSQQIRPAAVSGSFYPSTPAELTTMIEDFLSKVQVDETIANPRIIIVPHAGYQYSGAVAAKAFKQLINKDITRAVIIGPSHHFPLAGLVLAKADIWQTPLGEVKVSLLNKDLARQPNFKIDDKVHEPEHALEMQLPWLQIVLPQAEIIPIIVGQLSLEEQQQFAESLSEILDDQTVLIASVDLSHYHQANQAEQLDRQSLDDILNFDYQSILEDEVDAPWALGAVLQLAKEQNWQPKLLSYQNSGDVTGDDSAVVGYGAVVFNEISSADQYTLEEKREMLQAARAAISNYLTNRNKILPLTGNQKYLEHQGAFVTLIKDGKLRGCIGYIEPVAPLGQAIIDNAIAAAVSDHRFEPVEFAELAAIEIEISILTEPQPDSMEAIATAHKGVVLEQGNQAATYLPQVWESFDSPQEFFGSLCLKAGLAGNCYLDPKTKLFSYQAIVFNESELVD